MALMEAERFASFRQKEWAVPYHKLIGLEVIEAGDDTLTAKVEYRDELRGTHGAHGGLVASLLDSVCGYLGALAALKRLTSEQSWEEARKRVGRIATVDMHLNYIRPPKVSVLVGRASIVYVGSSLVRAQGRVEGPEGELIATCAANYAY